MALALDGTQTSNHAGGFSAALFVPATANANCLVFVAAAGNGGPNTGISDNGGGALSAWTKIAGAGSSGQPLDLWYAIAASTVPASTITVTVTNTSDGYFVVDCWCVSGADTSALDGPPTVGDGTATTPNSFSINTTASNTLVMGCHRNTGNPTGSTPPGGWTNIINADYVTYWYLVCTSPQTGLVCDTQAFTNGSILVAAKQASAAATLTATSIASSAAALGAPTLVQTFRLRPDADISDGGWLNESGGTSLFPSIDEVTASDADFIVSGANPANDVCEIRISDPGSAPAQPTKVRYRYWRTGAGGSMELRVRLLQGATQIASWTHSAITTTPTTVEQTLTSPQFASITDFTDLRLEFRANET